MAKLTEAQKAENKTAHRIREAGFKARRKEYDLATEKALRDFESTTTFKAEMESADAAAEAARNARNAEQSEIRSQIAALQTKINGLDAKHNLDELTEVRRSTNNIYHEQRKAVEDAVDAAYADIARVWSAAEWDKNKADGNGSNG